MIRQLKYLLCFLGIIFFCSISAQEDGGRRLRNNRKNPKVKMRISVSPVLSLYKTNKNHTNGSRSKMAYNVSFKPEVRLDKNNRDFLMFGVEYMFHGLSFNSYYFYSDSLQLYINDRLRYKYHLTMHELNFPIQLKHSFQKETNSIFSSYIFAGYCYRWIVDSKLRVEGDGNEMVNKYERVEFKSPAFIPSGNSFLNAGFGVQKNGHLKHNAIYAELQFRYGLSPIQFSEPFAPSNMYINSHFILLTIGVKI